MNATSLTSLATATELARRFRVSTRQIDYAAVIAGVEPSARVGITRLFDAGAAEKIRDALDVVRARRGGCVHAA